MYFLLLTEAKPVDTQGTFMVLRFSAFKAVMSYVFADSVTEMSSSCASVFGDCCPGWFSVWGVALQERISKMSVCFSACLYVFVPLIAHVLLKHS